MTVYVIETNDFPADWYVEGVSATPEAALRWLAGKGMKYSRIVKCERDQDHFEIWCINTRTGREELGWNLIPHELAE